MHCGPLPSNDYRLAYSSCIIYQGVFIVIAIIQGSVLQAQLSEITINRRKANLHGTESLNLGQTVFLWLMLFSLEAQWKGVCMWDRRATSDFPTMILLSLKGEEDKGCHHQALAPPARSPHVVHHHTCTL